MKKHPTSITSNIRHLDLFLLGVLFILVGISIALLLNATASPFIGEGVGFAEIWAKLNPHYAKTQLMWFCISLVFAGLMLIVDYSVYYDLSWYLYGFAILLLVLVLFFGKTVSGAKSWFGIGTVGIQPSEVAKITMILVLAKVMSWREKLTRLRDVVLVLAVAALPLILTLMQPDWGTSLVYIAILGGMLFAAGLDWRYAVVGVSGFLAAIPLLWNNVLDNFQRERVLVFLDPTRDVTGAGLQVLKSKIAIGSGQIFGKGFFNPGALSQLNYIPAKHNDFIFSVAGETMGFVGCMLIVALFALLLLRMLQQAMRARDRYGMLVVVGVISMYAFHIYENIGMTIGLMPVTGIPLPFVSYGGSNMLTNMIAISLVLNVALRRDLRPPHGGGDGGIYRGLYRP